MGTTDSHQPYSEEPLRPVHRYETPHWRGHCWRKPYTKRKNWWAELHDEDPLVEKGLNRIFLYQYREQDPRWYDPPVEDGTSLAGGYGKDSTYYGNFATKADFPMNLNKWQDLYMKESQVYKNVTKKWPLSKEHDGLTIPGGNTLSVMEKSELGQYMVPSKFSLSKLPPRFFDSAINMDCPIKALAGAKYAAIWMIPVTIMDVFSYRPIDHMAPVGANFGPYFARYARNCVVPCTLGLVWGAAICTSARIRNVDDVHNHWLPSIAIGLTYHGIKSNALAATFISLISLTMGMVWHYQRATVEGLAGYQHKEGYGLLMGGPMQRERMLNRGWEYISKVYW